MSGRSCRLLMLLLNLLLQRRNRSVDYFVIATGGGHRIWRLRPMLCHTSGTLCAWSGHGSFQPCLQAGTLTMVHLMMLKAGVKNCDWCVLRWSGG